VSELKRNHTLLFSTVPSRDESGKKVVTDENVDDDDDDVPVKGVHVDDPTGKQKQPCKYGAFCYQKNAKHLSQFSHPDPVKPVQHCAQVKEEEETMIIEAINNKKIEAEVSDDEDDYGSIEDKLDDVDDGENEQALISTSEWKQLITRISALESTVETLSSLLESGNNNNNNNNNNKNKRTRSDDSEDWGTLKKTKFVVHERTQ